jgi:PEGA domain-containing protein
VDLPFTVVFEPPSRTELRALLRMRGHWAAAALIALTIGITYLLANVARADAGVSVAVAPLRLESHPPGAAVSVDGRPRGATPVELSVEPGAHRVALKTPLAIDQQYALDVGSSGTSLDVVLWRREPLVSRLRPALPGAALADARLLRDGSLGLSIGLPPGDQLEAWRLDPPSGALEQLLAPTRGRRLAFAPDGRHVAYLGPAVGPSPKNRAYGMTGPPPGEVVWLAPARSLPPQSDAFRGWQPRLDPNEQLTDVSWSPDAQHLLVTANLPLGDGQALSRAWLLDAETATAEHVLTLPSQIVPGTAAWSPDGASIAFVAHAQQINALCLLGPGGSFRYLADLDASSAEPLNYPAASWSADSQRLLFVAPHQRLPGGGFDWLDHDAQHALYLATLDQPAPTALFDTRLEQVTWRQDGQVLGLWRGTTDNPLQIRLADAATGNLQKLVELPMQALSQYAATWDLAHAELLVASRPSSGTTEFWLARLGLDEAVAP